MFPPYSRDQTVSTLNTTTTPLNNGETFTGIGEQNIMPDVGVSCKTDTSGTIYFDFSNDNVNWDSTFPTLGFNVAAGIHEFHTAVKLARFFRVRFVNDSGSNHTSIAKYLRYRVVKPSGGGNPKVTIKGYVYNRSVDTRYEVYRDFVNTASTIEPVEIIEPIGFVLNPTDILYFVADTDSNNTEIYMRFSLNQYQNT